MNSNIHIKFFIFTILILLTTTITTVNNFKELAQAHCKSFPINLLYRLSTGQLSEIYGKDFKDIDCYIRQFVNNDGQDTFEEEESQQQQDEQQSKSQQEIIPDVDPLVEQYSSGLQTCLPQGTNAVNAVYSLWRFYRFIIQHDYSLEWMRAKVRSTLGYEAQKPSAWMDGEQSAARLRLQKLFSNQFYDYVDQLMFKDFLVPIVTFIKRNTVFAAAGPITASGKPILVQFIENRNLLDKIFQPIVFQHKQTGNIFTYTIPGIPLFLGGTSSKVSWAFTGSLVDRSNIEEIETLGQKFFHHGSQTWIKLQNISLTINIRDSEPGQCKFVHSTYGTLYEKHQALAGGKVSQYIARWRENQKKVRVVFSQLFNLIVNNGQTNTDLEFPFNSLVITNQTGIFHYVCFQKHPSYFLYPDLAGAPEPPKEKWASQFKRNFLVVSNTHLTTQNQDGYVKKEILNPIEQQFLIDTRRRISTAKDKFTSQSLLDFVNNLQTDPLLKKRKDLLIYIYRKTKFLFFPEQNIRKQCDQIVALLEKWDHNLNSKTITPAFVLWDYFVREYTFTYVSSFPLGRFIVRHKLVTDTYWTNQMDLWKVGTSYGECDSDIWNLQYKEKLNGTGDNSSCYLNVMRAINSTRQILRTENGAIREPLLADFLTKKIDNLLDGYIGSNVEQAFAHYYSKNLAFSVQIGNSKVLYYEGYKQQQKQIDLSTVESQRVPPQPQVLQGDQREEPSEDL